MTLRSAGLAASAILACIAVLWGAGNQKQPTPLDRYIEEAQRGTAAVNGPRRGSLFSSDGPLASLGRDPRASQVHDLVTILVIEQAAAVSKGATSTSRKSSAKSGISAFHGRVGARFGDLVGASGSSQLEGEGTTSRESTISTRLSARVTHVLPNGYLVVEGNKEVVVNSERQLVTVRGVVRPADLRQDNSVRSDRLAQSEIRINGKGVVEDAIRRPFFLYRLLMGILPF